MRRVVLIVPGLSRFPHRESVLRQPLSALRYLAEVGQVFMLTPAPRVQTPEALFLGMSPSEAQMAQGPLTVSALGADPPDRSIHFHLTLASTIGDALAVPDDTTDEEAALVVETAKRLDTSLLTLVAGERADHGLVLEALGDLASTAVADLEGKRYRDVLPEGDFEKPLRRYIDDSVNLLSDLDLNVRRQDEGRHPLNLLWPWGQGVRTKVPNLFLRRGERVTVESDSLRLQGLTRLTGYRHEQRRLLGKGVDTRLRPLADRVLSRDVTIALLDAPQGDEEAEWFAKELDRQFLSPLIESARSTPIRIVLLAPAEPMGLGLRTDLPSTTSSSVPFDERAFEERTVATRDLSDEVERGVLE